MSGPHLCDLSYSTDMSVVPEQKGDEELIGMRKLISYLIKNKVILTDQSHDGFILITVMEGRWKRKKSQGRPRKPFLDDIIAHCVGAGYSKVKQMAQDRIVWRAGDRVSRRQEGH